MPLRQVVYVSSGVKQFAQEELDDILAKARERNQATGITGVLFYLEGNFLQLLEGEEPALGETYARIKADKRHRGLTKLVDENVPERTFPQWQMGFRAILESEMREHPDLFKLVDGKWVVDDGAGVSQRVKIILETFLKVNSGRYY